MQILQEQKSATSRTSRLFFNSLPVEKIVEYIARQSGHRVLVVVHRQGGRETDRPRGEHAAAGIVLAVYHVGAHIRMAAAARVRGTDRLVLDDEPVSGTHGLRCGQVIDAVETVRAPFEPVDLVARGAAECQARSADQRLLDAAEQARRPRAVSA